MRPQSSRRESRMADGGREFENQGGGRGLVERTIVRPFKTGGATRVRYNYKKINVSEPTSY